MFKKVVVYLVNSRYYNNKENRRYTMNTNEITIFDVADFFLKIVDRDSGSTITPLKLQKLLYYAQGYYLAMHDKALFNEDFEAWAHGPANPKIYEKYKEYGYDAIDAPEKTPELSKDIVNFLYDIWATFGIFDGKYLEELTHKETPWINARKGCEPGSTCHNVITKESMKKFFKEKLNEQQSV